MSKITIDLPWPDPALTPNKRVHFMVKARAAKQAKTDGHWATLKALDGRKCYPTDGPILLRMTFYPPTNRRRDLDNLLSSEKHYIDGIAQALNIDDSKFSYFPVMGGLDKPRGSVIVEIGA